MQTTQILLPGQVGTFHCPCCGKDYIVTPEDHKSFDVCSVCEKPCCPDCESIAGEGVLVCTRCTSFSSCTHQEARNV